LLHRDRDFFYSYIGIPMFFSSYDGFFYEGGNAKWDSLPGLIVFLFHSYIGIHMEV